MVGKKSKKGLTLVEVMIAIILVSIIATGGLSYLYHSARIVRDQKDTRIANILSQRRMELILATAFDVFKSEAEALGAFNNGAYFYVEYDDDPDTGDGLFDGTYSAPDEQLVVDTFKGMMNSRVRFMDSAKLSTRTERAVVMEVIVELYYGPDFRKSTYIVSYHPDSGGF